ncbi:MAG: ABC transporter permease [Methanobacteriota archaeon]|nr:MAG: ABC transporter permease [Euryarchaeota archaeon]
MKQVAIAAYAARSVLRRRLGTTSALIGMVLGVAVVAAPWVALDSTLRGLADFYLTPVFVDVIAPGQGRPEENVVAASDAAAAVPNVLQAEPIVDLGSLVLNLSSGVRPAEEPWWRGFWIRSTFQSAMDRMGVIWTAGPAPGGVVVHDSFRSAGLSMGDTVPVERRVESYDANGTLIVYESWPSIRRIDGFYSSPSRPNFQTNLILFPVSDLANTKVDFNYTGSAFASVWVWLDRAALVNPYDPDGTNSRLQREHALLETALSPFNFYLGGGGVTMLEGAVRDLANHARFLRLWFLPFTIPTIALSVLLSRVGFDIGLSGRRRELAVLRARGVSIRGVWAFLAVEMSVIALLAALIGLASAILLSRLVLTLPLFWGQRSGVPVFIPPTEVAVSPLTVALTLGFAWLLGWLASWKAFRFAMTKDIVSAFRAYHAHEVSIPHRSSRDFLIATVGVAGLLLLVSSGFLEAGSDLEAWLGFPTLILAPIGPFLLTIGLARYLTRGTTRGYRVLARAFRPVLGELEPLVDKNIRRAPRRASNIAMIVTFAVAFLVAMAVAVASSETYLNEETRRNTPSDIILDVFSSRGRLNLSSDLRSIPGVAEVTAVLDASWGGNGIIVFDAATYLRTVPWLESRHLGGIDPRQLMDDLAHGSSVAVNTLFQRKTGLLVGDPAGVQLSSRDPGASIPTITARVAAVVPFIPGLDVTTDWPHSYLDFSTLPAGTEGHVEGRWSYLIDLSDGANVSGVVQALTNLSGYGASIRTFQDALRSELANPVRSGTFAYLATQSQLAAVLMVLGIGLLVFSAASSRRDELVTLVARGLPRHKVARLVMAEGWIVASLGILLGTFAGLLSAASLIALASTRTPTPIPLIVPWTAILPLLEVTGGMWVASFLGALSVQRMDVPRVLKLRGG